MSYKFDFAFMADRWPDFVAGAWLTIQLTVLSIALGFALGTVCALARVYGGPVVRRLVGAYVEAIRNTPLLIQIFIVYFGLSSLGLKLSADVSAVIALTVNMGAYSTEIIRAGIEAVPKGHIEAGVSLAMSKWEVLRHIVLKQAFEKIYPALSSQIIIVMLGSAVVSQISAQDLTYAANLIASRNFRNFEVYLLVALAYLLLSLLTRSLLRGLGRIMFKAK